MMKRKNPCETLDYDFIESCEKRFKSDPANIIARNAVNSVGCMFSSMNSSRVNQISHIFLNSMKKKHVKATDQGNSGRCWMFAALNIFRHIAINALDLENFEFSQTYLFFWDKLERANSYLQWFISNPDAEAGDNSFDYMIDHYLSDGGWWNTFANLVEKYGLVPADAMKETFQSTDSGAMNKIIQDKLDCCVNYILKHRNSDLEKIRKDTVQDIYNVLVKFLGEPPKKFDWFLNCEEHTSAVPRLTPRKFLDMIIPDLNMSSDFIVLAHLPTADMKEYTKYRITNTNNVLEGDCCRLFNVPIDELSRAAIQSVSKGFAVWFVGDVRHSFNWLHSTLDDELDDSNIVFGSDKYRFNKGERISLRNIQGCHAMLITGFNLDTNNRPVNWQVENSWGYLDSQTEGMDGFLNMSHSWFKKYVVQLVVHRQFLSRNMKRKFDQAEEIDINPWDSVAPAVHVQGMRAPEGYHSVLRKLKNPKNS